MKSTCFVAQRACMVSNHMYAFIYYIGECIRVDVVVVLVVV